MGSKHPEVNPNVLIKSPQFGQFLALHDKMKKAVLRPEMKLELGELAMHNVLLGDLFTEQCYNPHTHIAPCGDPTEPPQDPYLITCDHLSHSIYSIHRHTDQPLLEMTNAIIDAADKMIGNASDDEKAGYTIQDDGDNVLDRLGKDLENALPKERIEDIKEAGRGIFRRIKDRLKKGLEDFLGFELPDLSLKGLWDMGKNWLGDKAKELLWKGLETAIGAVVPIEGIKAAVNVAKAIATGDTKGAIAAGLTAAASFIPGVGPVAGMAAATATNLLL